MSTSSKGIISLAFLACRSCSVAVFLDPLHAVAPLQRDVSQTVQSDAVSFMCQSLCQRL